MKVLQGNASKVCLNALSKSNYCGRIYTVPCGTTMRYTTTYKRPPCHFCPHSVVCLVHEKRHSALREALSSAIGGGSAHAQPKESGAGDHAGGRLSRVEAEGTGRREGDSTDWGGGRKEIKKQGEMGITRERNGECILVAQPAPLAHIGASNRLSVENDTVVVLNTRSNTMC